MRKWCLALLVMFLVTLGSSAMAGDLIDLQAIREQPVNVLDYAYEGGRFGLMTLMQLLRTGKPVGMWNKENKDGVGGLGVVLIEGFLHERVDLVGGAIMEKEQPRHTFFGIEAKLSLKGQVGKVLSKFRPGVYWSEDKWWFGASVALRGLSTQGGR